MKIKKVCELNESVKDIIFVDNLVDSDTLTEEFIVSILDELDMMYKSEFMRKLDINLDQETKERMWKYYISCVLKKVSERI
jgi:hypothetical protein